MIGYNAASRSTIEISWDQWIDLYSEYGVDNLKNTIHFLDHYVVKTPPKVALSWAKNGKGKSPGFCRNVLVL